MYAIDQNKPLVPAKVLKLLHLVHDKGAWLYYGIYSNTWWHWLSRIAAINGMINCTKKSMGVLLLVDYYLYYKKIWDQMKMVSN